MTISTTVNRKEYNGNGSTTAFAYPYRFLADADLKVVFISAAGVETTWVLNTHYTVSGAGAAEGGTVTVKTTPTDYTPARGTRLVIYRDPSAVQTADFVNGGALDAEVLESALDRITMITQRLGELVGRSMRLSDGTLSSVSTQLPVPQAGTVLGWNSGGTAIANKTPNSETYISLSALGAALIAAASEAAARVVLGLGDAATKTTGTAAGNVPVLDAAARLEPALRNIPQNAQNAAYELVLADAEKHIFHSDATPRTYTIPANASVAFPIGTAVTIVNGNGAGAVTLAIATDTLRWLPSGATGSRTLAANGIATILKVAATEWVVTGVGVS
jgi:hypothetical protein